MDKGKSQNLHIFVAFAEFAAWVNVRRKVHICFFAIWNMRPHIYCYKVQSFPYDNHCECYKSWRQDCGPSYKPRNTVQLLYYGTILLGGLVSI